MTHHNDDHLFYEFFIEATDAHHHEEDNREAIRDTFNKLCKQAFGNEEVIVTRREYEQRTQDYYWQKCNNQASHSTRRVIKELVTGQLSFRELDDVLDTVLVVGKERRTLLRHLTTDDIGKMHDEREANKAKQDAAWLEWEQVLRPALDSWVNRYGTFGDAVKAGVVPTAAESDDQSA